MRSFQISAVFPHLTVLENVRVVRKVIASGDSQTVHALVESLDKGLVA